MGLGYVGLVSAACFASRGFKVVGFDVDASKVKSINQGLSPIVEPGLDRLINDTVRKGLLKADIDLDKTVANTDMTFVTVGTPSREDGSIDLAYVKSASKLIGEALSQKDDWHLVIIKSTVVPTATENIVKPTIEQTSNKQCGNDFGLCMNPEFLKEGSAIQDTLGADRIIIGEVDAKSGNVLEELYRNFHRKDMPSLIRTTLANAELIKYASNAFLAMKVSFINMIANLCQKLPEGNVNVIAEGLGLDRRIDPSFLRAGIGWGGSCWRKDLEALKNFAHQKGVDLPLVDSTLRINERQPQVATELANGLIGDLSGRRIAVLGLSFKPKTDDMRDAVSIRIVNRLINEGAKVVVYDPTAMENAKKIFENSVEYASCARECLTDAECALVVTEWDEFRKLTPDDFVKHMKIPAVVDGRRIYDPIVFSSRLRFEAVGLRHS